VFIKKTMEKQIAISYPESLVFSLKMQEREFEREKKAISLMRKIISNTTPILSLL
jgi:hypothetical protein